MPTHFLGKVPLLLCNFPPPTPFASLVSLYTYPRCCQHKQLYWKFLHEEGVYLF